MRKPKSLVSWSGSLTFLFTVFIHAPLLCAQGLPILTTEVNPSNGATYFLLESDSWTNSEAAAVVLGGHLVTIDDMDEQDWVVDTFSEFGGQLRNIWIGLTDQEEEGVFEWASGEPLAFAFWAPGEPNDPGNGEDYVHIYSPFFAPFPQWNDIFNSGATLTINGLVEINPCAVDSPTDVTCTSSGDDVELTFTNNGPYDGGINVYRDGEHIDTITDPNATSYIDPGVCLGTYTYRLRAEDSTLGCGSFSDPCTANHGIAVHTSQNTPLPIPDNDPAGITDTLDFSDSLTITSLDVKVEILHTWIGDLTQRVTSPSMTTVTLHFRDPMGGFGSSNDNVDVIFDDEGVPFNEDDLPLGLNMQPEQDAMADFNGEEIQGIWSFFVSDEATFDTGTLVNWEVIHSLNDCVITSPADPSCSENPDGGVDVTWENGSNVYTLVEIIRDGEVIDTLAGSPESYADSTATQGQHVYQVRGIDASVVPCCAATSESCVVLVGVTQVCSANTPVPIPDNDPTGIIDCIEFQDTVIIEDLQVLVQLTHTFIGDLDFTVTSPVGTTVLLKEFTTILTNYDDIDTTFDDAGIPYDVSDMPNGHNMQAFQSRTAMANFDGESTAGFWELTVTDNAAFDVGTLTNWCVNAYGSGSPRFIRGDANSDGNFNGLVDGLFILNFQFILGSPIPPCMEAADADNDGGFNGLLDGLYVLNFQFIPGSPPIPPPFPECGPDDDQALGCNDPPGACN